MMNIKFFQKVANCAADAIGSPVSIKTVSCGKIDADGTRTRSQYPTMRCYNERNGSKIIEALKAEFDLKPRLDLYEDDDGYPGSTRSIWSVELPELEVEAYPWSRIESDNYEWNQITQSYEKVA